MTINIDNARPDRCGAERQLQKTFRRSQITVGRQQEVDGVSG
jgi:hypothetical protein